MLIDLDLVRQDSFAVSCDILVNLLLQHFDFLVVLHNVLAVNEGTEEAIVRVLVLGRGRILHHKLGELLWVQI